MAMAVSQPVTGLELPAVEDNMEISSPYRRADDDIDIDIDAPGVQPQQHDEDYNWEDAEQPQWDLSGIAGPEGEIDYTMVDEDARADLSEDGIMRDDITVTDEHLADATLEDREETKSLLDYTVAGHGEDASAIEGDHAFDAVDDAQAHDVEDASAETADPKSTFSHQEAEVADDPLVLNALAGDASALAEEDAVAADEQVADEPYDDADLVDDQRTDRSHDDQIFDDDQSPNEGENGEHTGSNRLQLNTDTQTHDHQDNLQSAAPLHPVVVWYEGDEISLFPPKEEDTSETYFLRDENLVNVSISDLLRACRDVLGETIRDDQELELSVPDLGLSLTEDSLHASSTSFSEILDVYVQLQQQDEVTEANPLYITLTTKYRFSSRLAFLVKAAEDGLGLSQLDSCRDEELENSSVADENALTNNVGTSGDDNNFDGLSDSQRHTEDQKVNGGQETHTIEAGQPTRREDGVFDGSASAQSTVDQNAAAATNDANEEIDTAVGDRSSIKAGFEQSPAGAAQRQDYQSSDLIDYGDTDEIQAPEEAAKVDHGSSASSTARGDGDSENTISPNRSLTQPTPVAVADTEELEPHGGKDDSLEPDLFNDNLFSSDTGFREAPDNLDDYAEIAPEAVEDSDKTRHAQDLIEITELAEDDTAPGPSFHEDDLSLSGPEDEGCHQAQPGTSERNGLEKHQPSNDQNLTSTQLSHQDVIDDIAGTASISTVGEENLEAEDFTFDPPNVNNLPYTEEANHQQSVGTGANDAQEYDFLQSEEGGGVEPNADDDAFFDEIDYREYDEDAHPYTDQSMEKPLDQSEHQNPSPSSKRLRNETDELDANAKPDSKRVRSD